MLEGKNAVLIAIQQSYSAHQLDARGSKLILCLISSIR
jgi:hypothetical protein